MDFIKPKIFCLLIPCIVIIGCGRTDSEDLFYQNAHAYFPMKVGKLWNYTGVNSSLVLGLDNLIKQDNKWFAVMTVAEFSKRSLSANTGVCFFRYNSQGNIERWMPPPPDYLLDLVKNTYNADNENLYIWYKFNAPLNEPWFAIGTDHYYPRRTMLFRIRLVSITDTVVTENLTYENCYKFYIENIHVSHSDYYDWLAQDVGLVKRAFIGRKYPHDSNSLPGYVLSTFSQRDDIEVLK